jgi:MFS family permease
MYFITEKEGAVTNNITIEEADRKVFAASFEDGLVDIFLASVVLMFAVAPFLSVYLGDFWSSAIFLPFWGVVFLLLLWIRKNLVKPRAGEVKYGVLRRRKLTVFTGIMLVLNVVFMIFGFYAFFMPEGPGWTKTIPFAVMLLISFTMAGYFLGVTRFYLYGLLLSGGFFVGEWLYQNYGATHHGYPIVFGISSGVIFLVGLYKLITFLQNNPLPSEELLLQE